MNTEGMEMQGRDAELLGRGYRPYAVVKGGKGLLRFGDHADFVTDRDVNTVEVVPAGGTEPLSFVPRGANNNLPYELLKRVGHNVTVASNIDFKTKVVYGDGVRPFRWVREGDGGKLVKQPLAPSDAPDVYEFMRLNNLEDLRMELANDLCLFGDAYVEYIFDKQEPPRLVEVRPLESACSRVTEIDEKEGRSLWHGYSAEWHKGTPSDLVATPLLNVRTPLRDLLVRMGRLPDADGKNTVGSCRRFVQQVRVNTPGRFYYPMPYWWSVFPSGWYDFSCAIPAYKKALIKNQMSLRYVVYIREDFWKTLYQAHRALTEEDQVKVRQSFLDEMNNYLTGEENAGKTFVSHFRYDQVKGIENKDILIQPLDNALKGGEYIEDSEEASNTLSYGMGVHPSIIGSSPGKNKSINGTEARELFIITQALMRRHQEATLAPLYMAKAVNGWDPGIEFEVENVRLTTLDKGTGAEKNIGMGE